MYIRQDNTNYKTGNSRSYKFITGIYLCLPLYENENIKFWHHTGEKYKTDCAYGSRDNVLQTLDLPLPYLKKFIQATKNS